MESRLLVFIRNPFNYIDQVRCLDFDRLVFKADSAQLRPQAREQLCNIPAILKAYPYCQIIVEACTDNIGDSQHNLRFSQTRANRVVAELTGLGIALDRLKAQGYGDQCPVTDNSTLEGRAKSRRISVRMIQA